MSKSPNRKQFAWAVLLLGAISFILYTVSTITRVEPAWKFIIVGDSRGGDNGVNTAVLKEIAAEIVLQEAEFVLFPGDLVNGSGNQAVLQSQLTTWRDTMQPVYDAGIGVYPIRGNHDAGNLAAWRTVFSGEYALPTNGPSGEMGLTYSVSHKNVFVLALDQYISRHRVNQPWVDAQLAANTNPHIFAFGHEPAFKLAHADCLDDYPAERDAFWESLKNVGCRVYACGHDHFFDHAVVDDGDGNPDNDIHQYVVGTAGAPLYGFSPPYNGNNTRYTVEQLEHAKQYGYLLVEVSGSVVTRTWFEKETQTGTYIPKPCAGTSTQADSKKKDGTKMDYPKVTLSNGQVEADVFLPDAGKGYYRKCRFDWSGMSDQVRWNGHNFLCSSAVTGDMDFRACGTAEELCMGIFNSPGPLGYAEAPVGGGFIKPGVGILKKHSDEDYSFQNDYEIIEPIKWNIQSGDNWVEFSQRLADYNGWGYCYTKRITLSDDAPEILITRTLENLGSKKIEATHYCHNYLLFDEDAVGPNYEIKLTFAPEIFSDELNGHVKLNGHTIGFHREIHAGDYAFGSFDGFDAESNYSIVVENSKTKTAVEIQGDRPFERFHLYCQQKMICPEPFVKLTVEPGEKTEWETKYIFHEIAGN